LRERPEDIPALVRHFVMKYAQKMNRKIEEIPISVMDALLQYQWPGNIRELQNLIQRSVILSPGTALISPFTELSHVTPVITERRARQSQGTLLDLERKHIRQVLQETCWVLGGSEGAASRLGIPRTTLLYRMRRLGIPRQQD
jgi:formate hydrogenlyase transcriptional activator